MKKQADEIKKTRERRLKARAQIELAEEIEYSSSGNAIINISVADAEDFYSPYSTKGYRLMKNQVADYIEDYVSNVPLRDNLEINVYTAGEADADSQTRIAKTIKRTYAEKVADCKLTIKRGLIQTLIMLLVGVCFLILDFIAISLNAHAVINSLLEISAWVFVWGAVEILTIKQIGTRRNKIRYTKLMTAPIQFVSEQKNLD